MVLSSCRQFVENIDLQAISITLPFSRRELLVKFFRNAVVSVKDLVRQFPVAFIVPMNENINANVLVFICLTPIASVRHNSNLHVNM